MILRLTAVCSVASYVPRVQSEECGTLSPVHLIQRFKYDDMFCSVAAVNIALLGEKDYPRMQQNADL